MKSNEKVHVYKRFSTVDSLIIVIYAALFILGGVFFLVYTMGVSFPMAFGGWFVYLLGVFLFYKKTYFNFRYNKFLWLARIVGLTLMISAYLSLVICFNFENNKLMYPVKRFIYANGVKSSVDKMLPKFLYENVSDYYFRTEGCIPAQDYRPYCYLFIHTDEKALKEYESVISLNSSYTYTRNENRTDELYQKYAEEYPEEEKWRLNCPKKLPMHVYERLYKVANITDNLDNAIIYTGDNASMWNSYSGAMLNYETGLLAIWI